MHATRALEQIARAAAELDDGRDLLAELVGIDTPSADREAVTAGLSPLRRELEARGFAARTVEGEQGVPVLVADRGEGPPVGMVGHVDTVFSQGEAERRPFRSDDGRAHGPGVADMKGGLVAMLRCLDLLDAGGLEVGVRVVVNGDEELGSPTSREVLLEEMADASRALVFEPGRPDGEYVSHRRGTLRFRLIVDGVAAHSGVAPRDGANAIHDLARRIGMLSEIAVDHPDCDVNVTLVEGGSSINTVPDRAACTVDVRTTTRSEDEAIRGEVERIRGQALTGGATSRLEWLASRPPLERDPAQDPMLEALASAGRFLKEDVVFTGTGGGSDGNLLGGLPAPVIDGCGPVGGGYHREDEYIELPTIVRRAAVCAGGIALLESDDA